MSCQFALHYAWDSAERAEQVLRNGADRLTSRGIFILTYPDWNAITDRLFLMMEQPDTYNYVKYADGFHTYRIGGPRHYIEFKSEHTFFDFMQELQTEPFGRRYTYYQEGAVEGVPEYMVDPYTLYDMCKSMGLRVRHDTNFTAFDRANVLGRDLRSLRRSMGASKPLEGEPKLIAGLYRALVLEREPRRPQDPMRRSQDQVRRSDSDEPDYLSNDDRPLKRTKASSKASQAST